MSAENLDRLQRELESYPDLGRVVPSDLLIVLEPLQSALQLAYRHGHISLADLALALDLDTEQARTFAAQLVEKGYLQPAPPEESEEYHARFSGRITRPGGSPLDRI